MAHDTVFGEPRRDYQLAFRLNPALSGFMTPDLLS